MHNFQFSGMVRDGQKMGIGGCLGGNYQREIAFLSAGLFESFAFSDYLYNASNNWKLCTSNFENSDCYV